MSAGLRLLVALSVAALLHGLGLAAAAGWVPAAPRLPPVLEALEVRDSEARAGGAVARVRARVAARGPGPWAPATLVGELRAASPQRQQNQQPQPPLAFERPLPAGVSGTDGWIEFDLVLPESAAGPWRAGAAVARPGEGSAEGPGEGPGNAATRTATFWVDDGGAPDVALAELDTGGSTVAPGAALRIAWQRVNRGTGWLRPGGRDRVSLFTGDGRPIASALLQGPDELVPLAPGAASAHTLTLEVPRELEGVVRLVVEANVDRTPLEPHGPENRLEVPLLLEPSPFPDLAAVRLQVGPAATLVEPAAAPEAASSESQPQPQSPPQSQPPAPVLVAGETAPVRLHVENLRRVAAGAPRLDAFFLSRDDLLDSGDVLLLEVPRDEGLAGRGRENFFAEVQMPKAEAAPGFESGPAWLLGVVDARAQVNEGPDDAKTRRNNVVALPIEWRTEPPAQPDTPLGRDRAEPRTTVAWISHDAFEELKARQERTLQPTLQATAAPVPDAAPVDATGPPTPPSTFSPPPGQPVAAAPPPPPPPPAAGEPAAAGDVLPEPGPAPSPPPDPPEVEPAPEPAPEPPPEADAPTPQETPAPVVAPAPRTVAETRPQVAPSADSPAPPTPPSAASPPPAPDGPPVPTSAPKTESESDATDVKDAEELQPGEVKVGPGLQIDVTRPRIDPVALLSTVVRSPRVSVTFDRDGTVLNAQILRSAGSDAVDAPILRSIYRWRARGERLESWERPQTFEFTFLLSR